MMVPAPPCETTRSAAPMSRCNVAMSVRLNNPTYL
jgi:hypothetical protein